MPWILSGHPYNATTCPPHLQRVFGMRDCGILNPKRKIKRRSTTGILLYVLNNLSR